MAAHSPRQVVVGPAGAANAVIQAGLQHAGGHIAFPTQARLAGGGEGYVCVESLGALGEIVSTTAEKGSAVAGGWTLNKVGLVVTCLQGLKGMDTWERCSTFLLCSSGENNYILMEGIQR